MKPNLQPLDETNGAPAAPDNPAFAASCRWQRIGKPEPAHVLYDATARETAADYDRNIENYIGRIALPVGVAGPLRVLGASGRRDYDVPLATTEAALVASCHRGARVLTQAGGCTARVVAEGLSRTPVFAFAGVADAYDFARFAEAALPALQPRVAEVTRHGRLLSLAAVVEGNHAYLEFVYRTGDAAGQNMVTFVTESLCRHLLDTAPVAPRYWFLEANLSGDKKATTRALAGVRGRRVVADVVLPRDLVEQRLHTSPERMVDYWIAGALGGVMSGTTGIQGHYANALAALYLACGQDVACVAESATGMTRMEVAPCGGLYASVTLPNIVVGTVGGGTALPTAQASLQVLGLAGSGSAGAFAELCGGLVLAGEVSIIAAFCSGDFAGAHRALSRGKPFRRSNGHD